MHLYGIYIYSLTLNTREKIYGIDSLGESHLILIYKTKIC